jgi:hypothetical protein
VAEVRAAKFKTRSHARRAQINQLKAGIAWKVTWPVRQMERLLRKLTRELNKFPRQRPAARPLVEAPPAAPGPAVANVIPPVQLSAEAKLVYRDIVAAIRSSRGKV